jgi:N-acetylmuramoyl-L-alanine amidase
MANTIIVSAGHSNVDPGAVSASGLREADLALRLRDKIAARLQADESLRVLTDGRTGENSPLRDAVAIVKTHPGALAVELHFNAGPIAARGIEVLSKPAHKPRAQALARAIKAITGSPLRGDGGWKADNSGQHHRLAFCEAGGLIIEVEFLSNAVALHTYLTKEDEVATALANALKAAVTK